MEKSAERYMNVYENRHKLGAKFDSVSDLRVSEAYECYEPNSHMW